MHPHFNTQEELRAWLLPQRDASFRRLIRLSKHDWDLLNFTTTHLDGYVWYYQSGFSSFYIPVYLDNNLLTYDYEYVTGRTLP